MGILSISHGAVTTLLNVNGSVLVHGDEYDTVVVAFHMHFYAKASFSKE